MASPFKNVGQVANLSYTALVAVLLIVLAFPHAAQAHKLNLFARVDGTTIRGNAYFRGGGAARKAQVIATDAAGHELGRATTDDDGNFTMQATNRGDYRLTINSGDGHAAEFAIHATELPESLPGTVKTDESRLAQALVPAASAEDPVLAELKALTAQVGLLREELAKLQDQTRFRDLLGGIGFIAGISGAVFYVVALRRRPL